MRKTEQAQQQFRMASQAWHEERPGGEWHFSGEAVHHGQVAMGLALLAEAIRDIYDKLDAIHNDLHSLSGARTGTSRISMG